MLLANTLYASGLGALQLARVGILVKEAAPGIPTVGADLPRAGPRLPGRLRAGPRHALTRRDTRTAPTAEARQFGCLDDRHRSRIATTPWPPAAQIEISAAAGALLGEQLGERR